MANGCKNPVFWGVIGVLGCLLLGACEGKSETSTTTISAASSLTEAMGDLRDAYTREHPSQSLSINIAGSSSLSRQIMAGAPVDVFLSANAEQMQRLVKQGFVSQHRAFATNRLVVVTPANHAQRGPYPSLTALLDQTPGPIVIGDRAVPAGAYAHRVLEEHDRLERNQSRLVLMRNVRQVLAAVASGNAVLGFVYQSDVASAQEDVSVAWAIPVADSGPIVYQAGLLRRDGSTSAGAKAFYAWLQTDAAQSILRARAIVPIAREPHTP